MVRGLNPGGARFSAPVQTCLGDHLALCTMGNWSLSQELSSRDMVLTTHTHLENIMKCPVYALLLRWSGFHQTRWFIDTNFKRNGINLESNSYSWCSYKIL